MNEISAARRRDPRELALYHFRLLSNVSPLKLAAVTVGLMAEDYLQETFPEIAADLMKRPRAETETEEQDAIKRQRD